MWAICSPMTMSFHQRVCGCAVQVFLPCLDLYCASILNHLCLVVEGDRHWVLVCFVLFWFCIGVIIIWFWYIIVIWWGGMPLVLMFFLRWFLKNALSTPISFCHSLVWYCDDLLGQHLQTTLLPNLLITPVCPLMEVVCYLVLGLFLHFDILQDSDLALAEIQAYYNPVEVWSYHQNW